LKSPSSPSLERPRPVGPPPTLSPLFPAGDHGPRFAREPVLDANTYITTERLAADTVRLARELPADIDLVVAIPRSGLIPGSVLAATLHAPLHTVRGTRVQHAGHGARLDREKHQALEPRHVLIVDDTAARGRAMTAALPVVARAFPRARVTRAVIYSHPAGRHAVDLCAAILPGPHYLAWNWANAGHGASMAMDFDGVLCEDCPGGSDDDGERYARFLATTRPLAWPRRRPIHTIITARHRRYEGQTRDWLGRHGLAVDHLVMRDWDLDPATPFAQQIAAWKALHLSRTGLPLMAESCPIQAEAIARLTGKAVLCPAAERVFHFPRPPLPGPGTILRGWLHHFPWLRDACESCHADASEMDALGPAAVLADLETWTARLKAKDQAKHVPARIVRNTIRAAARKALRLQSRDAGGR
jgi:hypoxanthine phosphoribosyltransferase